jgi:thiamine-monophosphate kinase
MDPPLLDTLSQKLASWKMLTSMIDLSDGIASDLKEICRESSTGAEVQVRKLPISDAVLFWAERWNYDPVRLALTGGEDYHLLFTVSRRSRTSFLKKAKEERISFWEIGTILKRGRGLHLISDSGKRTPFPEGYEHFNKSRTKSAT